jgi:hypothetical protein
VDETTSESGRRELRASERGSPSSTLPSPFIMVRKPPAATPIRTHLPPFTDEQTTYLNSKVGDFICAKKKGLGYHYCQVIHAQDLKERYPVPPPTPELLEECGNDADKANVMMNKLRIAVSHSLRLLAQRDADVRRKRSGT